VKKNIKGAFWDKLVNSAKSDPIVKDKYGEYREGLFLFSCAVVKVKVHKSKLWSISIHSEHTIGLPMIKAIREKFAPDAFLMSQMFPSREEMNDDKEVILYQLPNIIKKEKDDTNRN